MLPAEIATSFTIPSVGALISVDPLTRLVRQHNEAMSCPPRSLPISSLVILIVLVRFPMSTKSTIRPLDDMTNVMWLETSICQSGTGNPTPRTNRFVSLMASKEDGARYTALESAIVLVRRGTLKLNLVVDLLAPGKPGHCPPAGTLSKTLNCSFRCTFSPALLVRTSVTLLANCKS